MSDDEKLTFQVEIIDASTDLQLMAALSQVCGHFVRNQSITHAERRRALEWFTSWAKDSQETKA